MVCQKHPLRDVKNKNSNLKPPTKVDLGFGLAQNKGMDQKYGSQVWIARLKVWIVLWINGLAPDPSVGVRCTNPTNPNNGGLKPSRKGTLKKKTRLL